MRSTAPQVGTGRSLQVDTTDVIHSLGVLFLVEGMIFTLSVY